ncbi:hypothetical protein SteCoe_15344 [Stentor coeruleus]|uniref:DUF3447 domain-containing protein n=1 Tax=Stentor coeruleus TaxID=5963 RepID=A0A1R2C3R9_9CILI|nr:hypothetical protein SteCoe_15344 [Stentor coeruleus]
MGCCSSEMKTLPRNQVVDRIKIAIEQNHWLKLPTLFAVLEKIQPEKLSAIDRPIIETKEITLNPFAYSIWLGQKETFIYMYENLHPNILELEHQLAKYNMTALDIICQKGYIEILKLYIPIYTDYQITLMHSIENHYDPSLPANIYTPIQKACEIGNIVVVSTIVNYYKTNCPNGLVNIKIPFILDINYQDENTGENCPLIACRNGNYTMMRYLHENCQANFFAKNKHDENAINVCLAGYRREPKLTYYECIVYLVNTIGVDFMHMHEESLLIAEDPKIIGFLEKKLKEKGVNVTKKDVERFNAIKQPPIPKTDLEIDLDKLQEHEFVIKNYIGDESYIEHKDDTMNFSILNDNAVLMHR